MPEGLLSGLLIIPILAVLILVHEIGHFVAARSVGVKVEEFGIGIPPRLKGWTRNGVIWSINWIPFGGFVRVLGEDGKNMDPASMNSKSPLQRAFFLVAGSAMNFLLAILLMFVIVGARGTLTTRSYINQVQPETPAAAAGWQVGDQIVEVAGVLVRTSTDVTKQTNQFLDRPMSVVIDRAGERIETTVTPRSNPPEGQGATGIRLAPVNESNITVTSVAPDSPASTAGLQMGDRFTSVDGRPIPDGVALFAALARESGNRVAMTVDRSGQNEDLTIAIPSNFEAAVDDSMLGFDAAVENRFSPVPASQIIPVGLAATWAQVTALFDGLGTLLTGGASITELTGPFGMGQFTSEMVERSSEPLWLIIANLSVFLSLNLGILNLLPLPALDGGRLLFVVVEVIRGGRRISPEREGLVHFAGLVILLGFMVVIAFLDIGRILSGQSLLP